eukprot:1116563-Rhodomonas_salina.3
MPVPPDSTMRYRVGRSPDALCQYHTPQRQIAPYARSVPDIAGRKLSNLVVLAHASVMRCL